MSRKTLGPVLNTRGITDPVILENFKKLQNYFSNQNQLFGFQHVIVEADKQQDQIRVRHNLGYIPRDVLVTRSEGAPITFLYEEFDENFIVASSAGAGRVRAFVGTYHGDDTRPGDLDEFESATAAQEDDGIVPSGFLGAWGGPTDSIPSGWLWCNGRQVSRSTYSTLFRSYGAGQWPWGLGNGSTTFNLPDGRGGFLRGVDAGAGNDPDADDRTAKHSGGKTGDNPGSYQEHAVEDHTHRQVFRDHGGNFGDGLYVESSGGNAQGFNNGWYPTNGVDTTSYSVQGRASIPALVADETRPRNFAGHWIIKT